MYKISRKKELSQIEKQYLNAWLLKLDNLGLYETTSVVRSKKHISD